MSIVLDAQRLSLILKVWNKNPNTPRNKCGGYLGTDYFGAGEKPYSEIEIEKIKSKLKRIAPAAYYKIYGRPLSS